MRTARVSQSVERHHSSAAEAMVRRGFRVKEERELMRRIRGTCGRQIEEATQGDMMRAALLAAITANESGGNGLVYRFEPSTYCRLHSLLKGEDEDVEGITREQFENFLNGAKAEAARVALLRKAAGRHGYTQIPGCCAVRWKVPLEALLEKERHFHLAARRLEELRLEFHLNPESHALELGRAWNTGHPMGRTRSPLYSWRLGLRRSLYLQKGRR